MKDLRLLLGDFGFADHALLSRRRYNPLGRKSNVFG